MKKKLLIIVLIVFIVALSTYFNYNRLEDIFKKGNSKNIEDEENVDISYFQMINQRYYSFLASLRFSGSIFPSKSIYDLRNRPYSISLKGKNIVALLSDVGCNPCQIRELKNIDSLYQKKHKWINVFIIYDGMNKAESLYLKKISQVNFKFYYTKGYVYNGFNFTNNFPVIFFINDNIILSTLIAIPRDDAFSSHFYKTISQNVGP
jgi:hypothetical protein